MFRNYFKVSVRGILKDKLYSAITLIGITAGISAFLLIRLYVTFDKSYDHFHVNKERIFRLQQDRYNQGDLTNSSVVTCAGAGPSLVKSFAEVERYVKILYSPAVLTYDNRSFEEEHFYFASEDFFRVFSFPLLKGVDSLVLKRPNTIVLSQTIAHKYFGKEDPIGKVLDFRGVFQLEVTGVYEDMPANSHMKMDLIASFETYAVYAGEKATTSWIWDAYYTYILLAPNASAASVEARLPALVERETGEWLKESDQKLQFHLQPLCDIHLHSGFKNEMAVNGNHRMIHYLSLIAFFILAIAYINYINIATVKSLERAKEVGIRKVLGGFRVQLMFQFLAESFILNLLGIIISFTITFLIIPSFAELGNREIDRMLLFSDKFLLQALIILVIGTIFSGLYPAAVLSGFKPVEVLKGKFGGSSQGTFMRKSLVVVQFIAAITLIICTYVVYWQIKYLRSQTLGFRKDNVLVVRASLLKDDTYEQKLESFKNELLRMPGISYVSSISEMPGAPIRWYANSVRRLKATEKEGNQYQIVSVDEDFMKVFDLQLSSGRIYTHAREANDSLIVINENASKLLGFQQQEDAINERVLFNGDTLTIIGVVQNYHHETLKYAVAPVFFPYNPGKGSYVPIRINTTTPNVVIRDIEKLYTQMFPGNPFSYYFLDEHYDQQYRADIQFGKVVGVFAALSIIITCLGLFGLSGYTILIRTREIGIRKVLGASSTRILKLLSRDYTLLIGVAMLIAIPLSWYVMTEWLSGFENRMTLAWWIFLLPNIVVVLIAWLTIGGHTLRAALANPADTLRHE